MVKDGRHRTRAIAQSGGEIMLSSKRQTFTLVSEIREEVYRFAIAYRRNKRKSKTLSSTLLRHFKTIGAIRRAGVEELMQVNGISRSTAETIRAALLDTGGKQ